MDAIVLAGGAGRRLGGVDKPAQHVRGESMLERVVTAVGDARLIAVVGPPRPGVDGVRWCREDPPGGGPVAAIAAGLQQTTAPTVVVLAADLPWVRGAVRPLLAALDSDVSAGCAVLTDASGRRNPLASAWRRRALDAALDAVAPHEGARAMTLLDRVRVVEVPDTGGWGDDCDTPADLARARSRAVDEPSAPPMGRPTDANPTVTATANPTANPTVNRRTR